MINIYWIWLIISIIKIETRIKKKRIYKDEFDRHEFDRCIRHCGNTR